MLMHRKLAMVKLRLTKRSTLWKIALFAFINLALFPILFPRNQTVGFNDRNYDRVLENKSVLKYKRALKPNSTRPLNLSEKKFTSLDGAHEYMKSFSYSSQTRKIVIQYSQFSRRVPLFISESDAESFWKSNRNKNTFIPNPNGVNLSVGTVEIVRNGTFRFTEKCEHRDHSNFVKVNRTDALGNSFHVLIPIMVPFGFLFQQFFDEVLPKIIQVFPFINKPNVKILLQRPRDADIYSFLEKLGITPNRIVWYDSSKVYRANYIIDTCRAPSLHPALFTKLRSALRVREVGNLPFRFTYVIYLSSESLDSRHTKNENDVISYLSKRYKNQFATFYKDANISQTFHTFQRAGIIIGAHSKAFFGLNYAPKKCHVIEFSPVMKDGQDILSLPLTTFWSIADVIGQTYWWVPCPSLDAQHRIEINLLKLGMILDEIDEFISI